MFQFHRLVLYLFTLLVIPLNFCQCHPVNAPTSQPSVASTPPEIIDFMRRFGYLDKTTSKSEALYHEDAIINAIKNVQKYGALNETGVLDNDTLKLMTAPRCGVPDIPAKSLGGRKKRFIIGSHGWRKRRITYYIANFSPKIGEAKVAQGMRRAFDEWAKYGNLIFERVFHDGADIIVAFGNGYHGDFFPFDGPGNILAHAFYPYEMRAWGGDIHFDNDENWKENATNLGEGVDFVSVAVHELGHSLGLAHSPVHSSIMFPYYKGPAEATALEYDDIMAMYELYIKNRPTEDDYYTTRRDYYPTTSARQQPKYTPVYATQSPRYNRPTPPPTPDEYEYEEADEDDEGYEEDPDAEEDEENRYATERSIARTTFHGDFETVDKYKRRFGFTVPYSMSTVPRQTPATDICIDQRFHSLATIRGEIYAFKDDNVWKLTDKFQIESGYPQKIRQLFPQLPASVLRIDAAYQRPTDEAVILFSDAQYWIYHGETISPQSPRPITDFGFGASVEKIDAAMVWSKNQRTYLFAGEIFLRFNEEINQMDRNYPMSIREKWRGIPFNLDAALSTPSGETYFFKVGLYWLYDNYWIRPQRGYPKRVRNLMCSPSPIRGTTAIYKWGRSSRMPLRPSSLSNRRTKT